MITGANVGIGEEVARQLAMRPDFARIYLACRNEDKATAAMADLEAATGRTIFDIVLMDVTDLDSVRAGVDGSIDALVMNAGVIGPRSMELTADGVTTGFATNVLGHVVLLETLLAEDRLDEVAVLAGSEAARRLPMMGMKRPSFPSTSADELATAIDGTYFADKKADFNLAFGQSKYIGALWMAYLARRYPDRRFITVSPGATTGTEASSNGLALPLRIAANYVMPALRISHKLDVARSDSSTASPTRPCPAVCSMPARPTSSRVPWSTRRRSSPISPTRRFRTTPTRPSTASSAERHCA